MTTATKKTAKKDVAFDYTSIKSFEDACKHLELDPIALPDVSAIPEEFSKPVIAGFKLMIIYKAINNGWKPDWNNYNQGKYYPWFEVLSSGFGFSGTSYYYVNANSIVGSRLCFESEEKAIHAGKNFTSLFEEFITAKYKNL